MWTYKDVPEVSVDMDGMRVCPRYETGFNACDQLGSALQWSGREPARVQRRRCRSEGIDQSPYEDVSRGAPCFVESARRSYIHRLPNKNHFTINNGLELRLDRYHHECLLPHPENGDYNMPNDFNLYTGPKQGRSKYTKKSPTRPIINTLHNTRVEDSRLPKVEELFEKVDHDIMDVAFVKQPLKSIHNNPLPKSPPPGILKKPKTKPQREHRSGDSVRRRQRAASEPDNNCYKYPLSPPSPIYDRQGYQSGNTKRARAAPNSGPYSYGTSHHVTESVNNSPTRTSTFFNNIRCMCKDHSTIRTKDEYTTHLLRTTAINSETMNDAPIVPTHKELRVIKSPSPHSASAKLNYPPLSPTPKAIKSKKKAKTRSKASMKAGKLGVLDGETEDFHSRPPSPDIHDFLMDTDLDMFKPSPNTLVCSHNTVTSLVTKLNDAIVSPKKVVVKDRLVLHESINRCVRRSLFPRVPPYLKFVRHDEGMGLKVPSAIQKHLKWKLTNITPIVVKKTLTNSGFRLLRSECDTSECPQEETIEWIGIWGKHMKSLMFRAIKDGQKMNHFPGTFQIGRKDRLWRNLQKLTTKFGTKEFGIMPKSYVLPHDLKILKHDWEKHAAKDERWIIKPPASARGTGIKVVSRWTQIPKKRSVVVQRYVNRPYLINGSKFDLRLYVLVTSVHPLRIYLYKDGLARFASVKYTDELSSLNDRYMHLTNYSINRLSKSYTPNEDFAACEGHKWTLETLFHYLQNEKKVDTKALWESIKDLVIKTIISGEASISALTKANVSSRYNCYELFGVDVLLDEDLKPWLLEVNISPSLHSASPLDTHVKGPLVATVLNLAQFHVPVAVTLTALTSERPTMLDDLPYDNRLYTIYLSKEERDKHVIYTNMDDRPQYLRDILSTLTPDDVRVLLIAEDELTVCERMERVFPTARTHRYLSYLTGPRYYNRLFDAWETRHEYDRAPGIKLLRRLCEAGYHLQAPPVPLKNDVDAPTPPASERPSLSDVTSLPTANESGSENTSRSAGSAASAEGSAASAAGCAASAIVPPASALRVCGDAVAHAPPLALKPRA